MLTLDLTLPTLAENLALDEALLLDAQDGGPSTLRFWNWSTLAVVVGAGGKLDDEVELERCQLDGVPVVRRGSGGGSVVIGPGCFLYSLVLPIDLNPALADLNASYRFIMGRIANALSTHLPGAHPDGISDLVWNGRKISGNAQQRKRTHILHHGTILDNFDLPLISRYLKHPPRMPDYRENRPHDAFVTNTHLGDTLLSEIIQSCWQASGQCSNWPMDRVRQLVADKYGDDHWHNRR
jgi:lipoate-protein ligase A